MHAYNRRSLLTLFVPCHTQIPTKHLEVTKQKLEATRLPHEGPSPSWGKATWWAPKSEVEQLIDFWYVNYVNQPTPFSVELR